MQWRSLNTQRPLSPARPTVGVRSPLTWRAPGRRSGSSRCTLTLYSLICSNFMLPQYHLALPARRPRHDGRGSRECERIVQQGMKLTRSRRRSEEHTSELQSHLNLVCRLLLEKKNTCNYVVKVARNWQS